MVLYEEWYNVWQLFSLHADCGRIGTSLKSFSLTTATDRIVERREAPKKNEISRRRASSKESLSLFVSVALL